MLPVVMDMLCLLQGSYQYAVSFCSKILQGFPSVCVHLCVRACVCVHVYWHLSHEAYKSMITQRICHMQYNVWNVHFNPSSKFKDNGKWETKLRRDKADTNKQDQEEKGEKVYSCACDNINLWWTQRQCCCWTDMEFSHWFHYQILDSKPSICRYW